MFRERHSVDVRPLRGLGQAHQPVEDIVKAIRQRQHDLSLAKSGAFSCTASPTSQIANEAGLSSISRTRTS